MATRPARPQAIPIPANAPELRPLLGLEVDDGLAVLVVPAPAAEDDPLALVVPDAEAELGVVAADEADEVDDETTVLESNRSR